MYSTASTGAMNGMFTLIRMLAALMNLRLGSQ